MSLRARLSLSIPLFIFSSLLLSSLLLSQSKAGSDLSDDKPLAALSRVRALYDPQRPDLIPYQADHARARALEDALERYGCGQVRYAEAPWQQ